GERDRHDAVQYFSTATELIKASEQWLRRVERAEQVANEARQFTGVMPDLSHAHASVKALAPELQRVQQFARGLIRRPSGKTAAKRIRLCAWIGSVLDQGGFSLSTTPADTW